MTEYTYASNEQITDGLETYMDRYKLSRERACIDLSIQFDWRNALDFGCGSGRYFKLFKDVSGARDFQRNLIGVDADSRRIREAEQVLESMAGSRNLEPQLVLADERALDTKSWNGNFDLVLCSHVLEHVTESSYWKILSGISACVAPGGRAIFLFQGFWDGVIEGQDLRGAGEYLHLIDTTKDPNSEGYRIPVGAADFDDAVRRPQEGLLPVRCLGIGTPLPRGPRLAPFAVTTCPKGLRPSFEEFAFVGLMYATHLREEGDGSALIGDFLVCFDRMS